MSSVFLYASASPSRKAGCLLLFLVSADLKFPQGPFGSNAEFFQPPLAVYAISLPIQFDLNSTPNGI
jgi:hypothetical protein